jgi:hypothetical protein
MKTARSTWQYGLEKILPEALDVSVRMKKA